jgi:hypothetical protein
MRIIIPSNTHPTILKKSTIFCPHFLKPSTVALARFSLFSEILAHTFGVRVLPDSTGAIAVVCFHICPDAGVYLNDFQFHLLLSCSTMLPTAILRVPLYHHCAS